MNMLGYEKLGHIPKKLFHFTLSENVEKIYYDRLLNSDTFGYVYLTETLDEAEKFANRYAKIQSIDIENFSILELDTRELDLDLDKLYRSTDHNPKYFLGAKAIAYNDDLEIADFIEYNFYG